MGKVIIRPKSHALQVAKVNSVNSWSILVHGFQNFAWLKEIDLDAVGVMKESFKHWLFYPKPALSRIGNNSGIDHWPEPEAIALNIAYWKWIPLIGNLQYFYWKLWKKGLLFDEAVKSSPSPINSSDHLVALLIRKRDIDSPASKFAWDRIYFLRVKVTKSRKAHE